jgi:hypothetical protein
VPALTAPGSAARGAGAHRWPLPLQFEAIDHVGPPNFAALDAAAVLVWRNISFGSRSCFPSPSTQSSGRITASASKTALSVLDENLSGRDFLVGSKITGQFLRFVIARAELCENISDHECYNDECQPDD